MNKEFQNKKHTQTRTGTHTKERNSESLRLKAPTPKQRAPGPNASDDALVVICVLHVGERFSNRGGVGTFFSIYGMEIAFVEYVFSEISERTTNRELEFVKNIC